MLIIFLILCFGFSPILATVSKVSGNILYNSTDLRYYTVLTSQVDYYMDLMYSTNLTTWYRTQVIFNDNTAPLWVTKNSSMVDPEINVIGTSDIRIYFSAKDHDTKKYAVSVAFADVITPHPYGTINRPLVSSINESYKNPLLLLSSGGNTTALPVLTYVGEETGSLHAVNLTADGLQVFGKSFQLLTVDRDWEGSQITKTWSIFKDNWQYILYRTDSGFVGVARSKLPFGPYEKKPNPIGIWDEDDLKKLNIRNFIQWETESGWPLLVDNV